MNKKNESIIEGSGLDISSKGNDIISEIEEKKAALFNHIDMLIDKNMILDEAKVNIIAEDVTNDKISPEKGAELIDSLTRKTA